MTRMLLRAATALAAVFVLAMPLFAQDAEMLKGDKLPQDAYWLDSLDLGPMFQAYGKPQAAKSVDGNPIKIKGVTYAHGVGTHAYSEYTLDLRTEALKFVSMVGVDDEKGAGSVRFQVWVDGRKDTDTGVIKAGDDPKLISVDLVGARRLTLVVNDGGDGNTSDHADWAGAMIVMGLEADKPTPASFKEQPDETVQIKSFSPPQAQIHGPRVVGATPGKPFLFLVPATGQGQLTFLALGLPDGLTLDSKTGIISGTVQKAGEYTVTLQLKDQSTSAIRKLKIIAGDHKLAQTPPMGWNSWNVWGCAVDDAKVRAAADWMVKSGLAAHGYQYVNIDDCWMGKRAPNGEITSNEKFPDMKALADYVHSKGLKLGIYSSPGPKTCAGKEGSYQHEEQDAATWAKWGIDYVKYDWCSYSGIAKSKELPELQKPYQVMRKALDKCDRDIVFSFCQYGMGDVWKWGAETGGNCWRTGGDITDDWGSVSSIAASMPGREQYAGPGHWNDPDMLVVGKVGWGPNLHPTKLWPNEQIFHMTMWSLFSSPLLTGCDLSDMDKFTLNLLTNDDVLAVNQDPLGKPASRIYGDEMTEIWSRPLWDGTFAVGLVNKAFLVSQISISWTDLGLSGKQPVRDLWRGEDVGAPTAAFTAAVPAHCALLLKIGKPNKTDW